MEIYYILLWSSIIGVFLSLFRNKSISVFCYFIVVFFSFIIVAFRDETIGTDTEGYYYFFKDSTYGYGSYDDINEIEWGYRFISSIIRYFTNNGHFFLFFCASISMIPIYKLIWKESKNVNLSIFLFLTLGTTTICYILFFSMIRQCMAYGLITIILYLYHKKTINRNCSLLLLIFVCLIHKTTLLVFPFLLLSKFNFSKFIISTSIIISLIFGMALSKYSMQISLISTLIFDGKFNYYSSLITENIYSFGVTIPLTAIGLLITFASKKEFLESIFVKFFLYGIVLNNLFSLAGNSDRLCLYFVLYGSIVIPNFLHEVKMSTYAKCLFILFLVTYYSHKYESVFLNAKDNPITQLVPYKSILF